MTKVKKKYKVGKQALKEYSSEKYIEKAKTNFFFQQVAEKLQEDITGTTQWSPALDKDDACPTLAVHDQVIEGAEPNVAREFISVFKGTKKTLTVPVGDNATAKDMEDNEYTPEECAAVDCVDIEADEEPDIKPFLTW